jgi:hypothetical protein
MMGITYDGSDRGVVVMDIELSLVVICYQCH